MGRRFLPAALLLLSALACSSATEPEPIPAEVVGSYVLVEVAGNPLPYCPRGEPHGCVGPGVLWLEADGDSGWDVSYGHDVKQENRSTFTVRTRPDGFDPEFRPRGERHGPPVWEGVYSGGTVEMLNIFTAVGDPTKLEYNPLRFEKE